MFRKLLFPIFCIILLIHCEKGSGAANFTKREMIIIHDQCMTIIRNYEELTNKLGEEIYDVEKTKGNIEAFINLFVNRKTLIFNDLDPSYLLSEFYEVETYASNMSLWYPDGIRIILDYENARISNILQHGENIYSIDVVIPKHINGNYLNKAVNNNDENLLFRVVFYIENGKVGDVKIAGLRNASGDNVSFDNQALDEVKSAEFSENEKNQIYQYARSVINDYTNYLNLIGNPDEVEEDKVFYREALINIVKNTENNLYNDLEENPDDPYFNIQEYLDLFHSLYSEGINNLVLNTDSATFSKIIRDNDKSHYVYVYLDKFFSGKMKGKNLFRFQDKLIVKVTFDYTNQVFSNFIISGIDHAGINETLAKGNNKSQDISSFNQFEKRSRKGWYGSVSVFGGMARIADIDGNISNEIVYGGQLGIQYMFHDHFGIEAGLGYHEIKTKYSISSRQNLVDESLVDSSNYYAFIDPTLYIVEGTTDAEYYKIFDIPEYDSVVKIRYINIPLLLTANVGKTGKINAIFKTGFEMSLVAQANYATKGSMEYLIFSRDIDQFVSGTTEPFEQDNIHFIKHNTKSIAEPIVNSLKLYRNDYYDIEKEVTSLKKLDLRYIIHAGIDIPLGYFLSINTGITYKSSILSLSKNNDDYVDMFGQTETNPNITASNHVLPNKGIKTTIILVEVGMKYKF